MLNTETMETRFTRAEEHGLWFYSAYQSLWFSPRELRQANANGKFRWGPNSWELRDPQEFLTEQRTRLIAAEVEMDRRINHLIAEGVENA